MSSAPSLLTREEGTSSRARRLPRVRPSASHVLVAISVLLAFVFNMLALQQGRGATELVAVADETIDAGARLSEAAIRWAPIGDDFEGLDSMITQSFLGEAEDLRFIRSVSQGTPLDRASVSASGAHEGLRVMSLPIAIEHAAGAGLRVGDRVDAISVVDGVARFIALHVEVVGISGSQAGGLSGASPHHVLLAVTADHALSLALAVDIGSLELVRSTGAFPVDEDS